MVYCEPYMFFFVTPSSYGFISNPHSFNFPVIFFQNGNSAWRVPYSAFLSLKYTTGISFLCTIHFSYFFGSTCARSASRGPVSHKKIILYISVFMNDLGMSHVTTYLFKLPSITQETPFQPDKAKLVSPVFMYNETFSLPICDW